MNLEQAKAIYEHPKGHTKDELTECLRVLNVQPRRLSLMGQVVIADARDILEDTIMDAEYKVLAYPLPQLTRRDV